METIIQCCNSDRTLVFDAERQSWLVAVKGKRYFVGDGDSQSILALLPFLELSVDSFKSAISEFASQHPACDFPYEVLIRGGFLHGSPHWTDCSLHWLSELREVDADFTDELQNIIENKKRYSQKSRQMATRLTKRSKPK
ncbi:hypothetical protein [Thalassospira lucentensis]|uniref:hypothetical protein n=1 Tax=Thalassospira lucentensis TaxID=168935 RepID=UPI00142D5F22|nr:hypothetical protein [Thalassospira lucentensis]NIZ01970.1 hypothetical protein [Thalassospira lucentensis]